MEHSIRHKWVKVAENVHNMKPVQNLRLMLACGTILRTIQLSLCYAFITTFSFGRLTLACGTISKNGYYEQLSSHCIMLSLLHSVLVDKRWLMVQIESTTTTALCP